MITLNLDLSANTFVLPLYGLQATSGDTYTLLLVNSSLGGSGTTYALTDTSPDPAKYQQFTVLTSGFTMPLGDYAYTVFEGTSNNVLSIGRWQTIGAQQVQAQPKPYENPNAGQYTSYKNPYWAKTN